MSKGKMVFAKEYEEFLITGNEDVCNSLPNGSLEKEYFLIMRQFLKEEYSPELEKKIKQFLDKSKYELSKNQTQRLAALYLYKKLQKNPDSKKDIISNIKELFQLGNVKNYSKPVKYNKMTKEEGDEGEKKIPYKLDEEKYIKVYKLIEDIYGGKILSNKEDLNKILRSQYLKYELDFNKIPIEF